jgi:hypothetical protein
VHTRHRARYELSTDDAGDARIVELRGRAVPADLDKALCAAAAAADAERRAIADAAASVGRAEAHVRSCVQELRAAGVSWTAIGHALGLTRGTAQKRYGADQLL